jgi:lysophospholipase L1-like esterase
VFSFGLYDMADESGGALRVPLMESMAQAQAIVSAAAEVRPVLWVGPVPIRRQDEPVVEDGQWMKFSAHRLEALNAAYGDIARRLNVPYLDLFAVLGLSPEWQTAHRQGNGVHPVAQGHAALADAVHGWPAWRRWIDGTAVDGVSGRLGRTG